MSAPICYNTSTVLNFETLPSAGIINNYTYQWQKSLDQSIWTNITDANTTSYNTGILETDTYYRVLVECENVPLSTNVISVVVLPPLDVGVLEKPITACEEDEVLLTFEIGASGAEWSWGGFLEFDYQWEQNNAEGRPFTSLNSKGWFNVGGDWNIYSTTLSEGYYYFRCLVTSPYGCGSIYTNTIMLKVENCTNGRTGLPLSSEKSIVHQSNILGAQTNQSIIKVTIYDDGNITKEYIIK
mgnify:CR=1 FL=1